MRDYPVIAENILNMTRAMLKSAQAAEWEKVQYHQQSRQLLLKDLNLNRDLEAQYEKSAAAYLQEILSLNETIIELSVNAKTDLKMAIESIKRGWQASIAYGELG